MKWYCEFTTFSIPCPFLWSQITQLTFLYVENIIFPKETTEVPTSPHIQLKV